jgi:beta-glucanase (GH16 family)
VDTKNKYSFKYGTVEVRAKLPKGRGLWPAIWLVQKDCPSIGACPTWPPEIDIMENRGDIPNRVTMALHFGRYPNNNYVEGRYDGPDFTSDYHNFKVVWTQSSVTW